MPEYQSFIKEIEVSSAKYQSMLKEKYSLYQQKVDAYQKNGKGEVVSAVIKDQERELQNLQESIQEFQTNSENDLKEMYQRKFSPIKEKIKMAISEYGKENSFTYILRVQSEENAGETRPILLYSGNSDYDISQEVLSRLGVSRLVYLGGKN